MRRRYVLLASLTSIAIVLAGAPGAAPRAQQAPTNYTITRIAAHAFPMVVLGAGDEPQPQWINVFRPSINDQGVVAFGHAGPFPLNYNVVSTGDGGSIRPIHGGGQDMPDPGLMGLDGDGKVYVFVSSPDPLAPPGRSNCIVRVEDRHVVACSPLGSTLMEFIVAGTHARLRIQDAARIVYRVESIDGTEYHTEHGLVVKPGGQFTSVYGGEYDINASGEVVFMAQTPAGFGIFAARAGEVPRTVFLNFNNPGGIGFTAIHYPRIDDSGRVFFTGSQGGAFQNNIYRIDPGDEEPTLVIDGNNGPLVVTSTVSINGAGSVAFLGSRGVGNTIGLYAGPDPDRDRVIAVGDSLDGKTIQELRLADRALNNNAVAGLGQIVFAAVLDGDQGYTLYRADPPGATAENSIKPLPKSPGSKTYQFARAKKACRGGCVSYWDPPMAIGYEYALAPGDSPFESVVAPSFAALDTYELQLWNGMQWMAAGTLTGGVERVFPAGGVDRFRIAGIPESLGLDVDDPEAFVVGLRFVDSGASDTVELSMTPLTASTETVLSWSSPSSIVYGTPIGAGELDATSNVPGTFRYSPAPGAILHAGTHTLSVIFTPDDPEQAPATASVVLHVLPTPLTIAADDKTITVGDPLPVLTASYQGFVNGDTAASLDVPVSLSTTATGSTAGDFPIVASGASDSDYDIEFLPGTLSVRARSAMCLGEANRRVLWPINPNGTSVFKKGSSVIIRFRVCNANGASIGTPGLVTSFVLARTDPGTAVNRVNELPLLLPSTSTFQWDPFLKEWFFVLSTRTLATNRTYSYRIGLRDGTAIDFRFGVR